jgi:hypothetical protein
MTPTCTRVIPPPLTLAANPTTALNIASTFNRPSYLAQFGVEAPDEDPTLPLKTWFLTDVPAPGETFSILEGYNPMSVGSLAATQAWAASINLPGYNDYPAFTVAPTPAMNTEFGPQYAQPLNPSLLSSYEEAVAMGISLGTSNPPTEAPSESIITWNGETRRIWNVDASNGDNYTVGPLLPVMYARGIGSPGKWDLSTSGYPKWGPATQVDQFAHGLVPTPIRPPVSPEVLQNGPMGMGWIIAVPGGGSK